MALGAFTLKRKLGSGGMAEVFLAARTTASGAPEPIAVKMLLPEYLTDPQLVAMLGDEARVAALLHHPNIVELYESGTLEGRHYLAMEYVHGVDAAQLFRECNAHGKLLPAPLACRIVIEACRGLHFAHLQTDEAGRPLELIHRDVSPQNLLIRSDGVVKLTDFGVARATGKAVQTAAGMVRGKFAYMSPEQALAKPMDQRTDVFALGVVLYELLTGTRLFKGRTELEVVEAVVKRPITPPSELRPTLPLSLDLATLKALSRAREDRFATARLLQEALEAVLIEVQAPASNEELGAFVRGHFPKLEEDPAGLLEGPASARAVQPVPKELVETRELRQAGEGEALPQSNPASAPTTVLRATPAPGASQPETRSLKSKAPPPTAGPLPVGRRPGLGAAMGALVVLSALVAALLHRSPPAPPSAAAPAGGLPEQRLDFIHLEAAPAGAVARGHQRGPTLERCTVLAWLGGALQQAGDAALMLEPGERVELARTRFSPAPATAPPLPRGSDAILACAQGSFLVNAQALP